MGLYYGYFDFGFHSDGGIITIRKNGDWVANVKRKLVAGDRLQMRVNGTTLKYLVNGTEVARSPVTNINKLYNGKITQHRKVESYSGKVINVDSPTRLHLETDGETLGHSPIEFQIIPRSVKVIANGISA